jgi:FkbH-like protein
VLASYESKAAQISALVAQLNVGLDACVFVDDNPVEIAAVAQALPTVTCVTFPAKVDGLVETVAQLEQLFSTATLTDEDKQRTRLYRTRLAGMVPVASAEVNLESFLRELDMVLHIFNRTTAQQERAIQLINKTNQFNLNGIRYTDAEVKEVLVRGGRLLTAQLKDKHGDHGEIIACLIDCDETLLSLVMSCRVMQRKVEQVFLGWLTAQVLRKEFISMRYLKTERNTPVQQFLAAEQFTMDDELTTTPRQDFAQRQQVAMSWFTLVTQE